MEKTFNNQLQEMKKMKSLSHYQKERIKKDVMAFVVAHPRKATDMRRTWFMNAFWGTAVAGLLFVAVGTSVLAEQANPGDILYPVKRWSEGQRLAWTSNPEAREDLLRELALRRINELDLVIATGESTKSSEFVSKTEEALAAMVAESGDEGLKELVSERLASDDTSSKTLPKGVPEVSDVMSEAVVKREKEATAEADFTDQPDATSSVVLGDSDSIDGEKEASESGSVVEE